MPVMKNVRFEGRLPYKWYSGTAPWVRLCQIIYDMQGMVSPEKLLKKGDDFPVPFRAPERIRPLSALV
jgi:hypothetical protein